MNGDREGLTLPYEYEERATRFVEAVKDQVFSVLEKEGFSCQAFTLSEAEEDEEDKKKAKNLLKKLLNITWGKEKQKIIIEDPSGNSAIISDKAVKSHFKVKKAE